MNRSLAGVSVGWLGISMVADGVPALLVPHQLTTMGADATALGVLTLVAIGAAAAAQPAAGAWSDRIGRAPVVVVGISIAVAGLVLLLARDALVVGTIVSLVGVSVAQAGYQALLPDRIPRTARGMAAGAKGLWDVGGAFVGFTAIGGLLAIGAFSAAVVTVAIVLAGSLLVGLVLSSSPPTATASTGTSAPMPGNGGSSLVGLVVARFVFLLGIYAVGRFLLLFTADRLGLGADAAAASAGTALAVLALLTALTALPAGWCADRFGRRGIVLIGGLLGGAGIAALPLATSLPWILASGALMAVGTAAFGAGSWAALADAADGPRSARLLGFANLGTAGAAAAAGLFGPIIDGPGYGLAFVLAGAMAVIGGLVGWNAVHPAELGVARPMQAAG